MYIRLGSFVLGAQPLDMSLLSLCQNNKTLLPAELPQCPVSLFLSIRQQFCSYSSPETDFKATNCPVKPNLVSVLSPHLAQPSPAVVCFFLLQIFFFNLPSYCLCMCVFLHLCFFFNIASFTCFSSYLQTFLSHPVIYKWAKDVPCVEPYVSRGSRWDHWLKAHRYQTQILTYLID
jgi:hypothetical protein